MIQILNCFIKGRERDFPPVVIDENNVFRAINLNRYAIIPLEEYEQLKILAGENVQEGGKNGS